jgi:hypothetical protein
MFLSVLQSVELHTNGKTINNGVVKESQLTAVLRRSLSLPSPFTKPRGSDASGSHHVLIWNGTVHWFETAGRIQLGRMPTRRRARARRHSRLSSFALLYFVYLLTD